MLVFFFRRLAHLVHPFWTFEFELALLLPSPLALLPSGVCLSPFSLAAFSFEFYVPLSSLLASFDFILIWKFEFSKNFRFLSLVFLPNWFLEGICCLKFHLYGFSLS